MKNALRNIYILIVDNDTVQFIHFVERTVR